MEKEIDDGAPLENLSDSDLAKQVWMEQRRNDWPGLAKEVSLISKELELEDVNETGLSKTVLRKLVNAACLERNETDLKEDMVGKTKLIVLAKEDCKAKGYLSSKSMKDVRDIFRARTEMTAGFRGNFHNMYRGGNVNCEGCGQVKDTQSHATECPAYADLKEGLDFNSDGDLVAFFRRVMERRAEKEN